ncbi:tetratricopeptide repeat protein,sulfotransferase family protein [Xenococcus sp. PCC 7305]|uniref:tetratricopeptide repeat protein n=1 Tax=Xenococcus sp. PCC 7305 TaxID=102125 RepID=UPI0002ABD11F|nr:tetratricopeptide repeat protein [Xenococcus sp. PCC 7305]ELS04867.1 tetratricopeptide repeat protein,sulfotransferase family protein [Xenococcus sp. PCC 7305]
MEQVDTQQITQDLLEKGHKLRKECKLDEAISTYKQGIKVEARSHECYHFIGEVLAQKDQLEQAIKSYEKSIKINPNYCWSYHCLGLVYFWQGQLDKAIAYSRLSLEKAPNIAVFYYHLGLYLKRQGNLYEAIYCCQKAIGLDPNLAQAHHILGQCLAKKKQWKQSYEAYIKALKLDSNLPNLRRNLADVQLQLNTKESLEESFNNYLQEIKQHPDETQLYHKALEIKSDRPEIYEQLADALARQKRFDGAICFYKIALNLNPNKIEIYSKLGNFLTKQKRFDGAIANLRKVTEIKPHFSSYHALGLALENNNQIEEAIRAYRNAIKEKPDYFWSYRHLGLALVKQGELEEAIKTFRYAVELNPDYHGTYFDLGKALEKKSQIISDQNNLQKSEQYLERGIQLQKKGKLQEATECYLDAISKKIKNAKIYYELGTVFQQQGKLDKAIQYWFQSIEIEPTFGPIYHKLIWSELNASQIEKAISCCDQAILSCKDNATLPLIYTTVAELLTKQGQLNKANKYYQTALEKQVLLSNPQILSNLKREQERKPHFLVIGGMKCGSTSLYTYLSEHPQIIPALKKEIHFFNSYYDRGIDWYSSHFFPILKEQSFLTGEATPCLSEYGVWSKIAQHFPELKLIVVLRNPVERAYSHYNHTAQWFGAQHSFKDSILSELENTQLSNLILEDETAYRKVQSYYILLGLYVYWLKEWMKFFPREQFLILRSEDLYTNPANTMNKVYKFLNISSHKKSLYQNTFAGKYLAMDESLRHALVEYYQPHNQKLEDFLGMNFNWN